MEENPTSIYHDTVSIGGGTAFPQIQPQSRPRSESLMFNEESPLVVEISGAMSDKDRVLFTIHTKVSRNRKSFMNNFIFQLIGPIYTQ